MGHGYSREIEGYTGGPMLRTAKYKMRCADQQWMTDVNGVENLFVIYNGDYRDFGEVLP